jgi:5'-nucleotidase
LKNRNKHIKFLVIAFLIIGSSFTNVHKSKKDEYVKITILHTNDTHSRIEPFATNDPKLGGLGGFAKRAALIKKIRSQEKNVLLFDSGDIFQGSPYFNFWGGELEFKLMSQMGYDAATIGNHEFDNGIDGFAKTLPFAKFPFLNCNYDFSKTVLKDKIQPYKIFEIQGIKVGVFGLGVELEGLVNKQQYGETVYHNAYQKAAEISHHLKKDLNCDLIICLSHLGCYCDESKYCDVDLAKQSKNIDLILGGHSHTQIDKPYKYVNSDGKEVIICQVGWAGIKLGRIDYYFNIKKGIKFSENYTTKIIKNQV